MLKKETFISCSTIVFVERADYQFASRLFYTYPSIHRRRTASDSDVSSKEDSLSLSISLSLSLSLSLCVCACPPILSTYDVHDECVLNTDTMTTGDTVIPLQLITSLAERGAADVDPTGDEAISRHPLF